MENIKFKADQDRSSNLCKNARSKLLKCCANIYFNKHCLAKKAIPSYANIKFQNTSPVAKFTSKKAQTTRIKDEIRLLFKKNVFICTFVGFLWGHGICLHPFYFIDDGDDDDVDDDNDGDDSLRNINILLVEENVYRTLLYSVVSHWF